MNELLNGALMIKMYAWEKPFETLVKNSRNFELKSLVKTTYVRSLLTGFSMFLERATLYLTTITYVLLGNHLTPDKVYSVTQLFQIMQTSIIVQFSSAVSQIAETLSSVKRIEEFLLLPEFDPPPKKVLNKGTVKIMDVFASWESEFELKGINIKITAGSLCAIVGHAGSGKSSLLQLLLNEINVTSGTVEVCGEVSYTSQEPWLFASTIRQNILFGEMYRQSKYDRIIRVCGLEKDFLRFSLGDQSLVGERGVTLSGDQKARICLARAIYRIADVYLLDDPLSAMDPQTAEHLFVNCILQNLRGKTRILVTHQLHFLSKCNHIVFMQRGAVVVQGNFDELWSESEEFRTFMDMEHASVSEVYETGKYIKEVVKDRENLSTFAVDDYEFGKKIKLSETPPVMKYIVFARSSFLIVSFSILTVLMLVLYCCADLFLAYWSVFSM